MASESDTSRLRESGVLATQVTFILAVFSVVGLASGWLWHRWWAPGPTGVALNKKAYFVDPDADFSAIGKYVVVAAIAGLVLGIVVTYFFDRHEVVTVFAVLVGAGVAGVLMAQFGHHLGPDASSALAKDAADLEPVPRDLRIDAFAAYAVFPGATMVGNVLVLLLFPGRNQTRQSVV